MYIAPQTTSTEITDKINAILHSGKYISETDWKWRQIKRECEKLRDVCPSEGWSVLSCLYALNGNIEESKRSFDAAKALGSDPAIYKNWLANLVNVGLFIKAQELYAVHGSPTTGEFTNRFSLGLQVGAFQKLAEFIESAKKMGLDMTTLNTSLVKNVAALLRTAGLNDHDVSRQLEAAGKVLNRNRLISLGDPEISVCDIPDEFTGVTFALRLPVDAADIFSYNIQLAKEEIAMNIKKNQAFDVVFIQQ